MEDESWRDGSLAQRILHMLISESMADCTFVVGITEKKKFQCHKNILSHGSSVFYAMFNGGLEEKGEVKVEDIEPQHFRKMLEFIYSDNTDLENVETAMNVWYAANKYMINTFTLKCINFIKKILDPDTVCRAFEFARLINNADLEAKCVEYLQTNTSDVLKTNSFPNAKRATLLTILGQDDLFIKSEVELFSACVRWAKANQYDAEITLREVLGPEVLSLIRILNMTAQEFATIVVPSNLLEMQEERDILFRFVSGTGNVPQSFSNNTEIRAVFGTAEAINIKQKYIVHSCPGQDLNSYLFIFNVDVESSIHGLQLHGLYRSSPDVEDSFVVYLWLATEFLASAKFEGLMSSDNAVEVNFNKPFRLLANTNYTLQICYSNLNTQYSATYGQRTEYIIYDGAKMNVWYSCTTISKIYLAKRISKAKYFYD